MFLDNEIMQKAKLLDQAGIVFVISKHTEYSVEREERDKLDLLKMIQKQANIDDINMVSEIGVGPPVQSACIMENMLVNKGENGEMHGEMKDEIMATLGELIDLTGQCYDLELREHIMR